MPPDTHTNPREGLIQVIAVRLDNLHADVSGMRDVLKEMHDHFNPLGHSTDWWDFLVTCFGGGARTAFLLYV